MFVVENDLDTYSHCADSFSVNNQSLFQTVHITENILNAQNLTRIHQKQMNHSRGLKPEQRQ